MVVLILLPWLYLNFKQINPVIWNPEPLWKTFDICINPNSYYIDFVLFANVILLNIGLLILYLPRNKYFNFYFNLYLTFSLSTLIVLAARKATNTSEAVIEKMWNLASTTPCLMQRRIATVIKFKGIRNRLMIVDLKC